MNASTSSSTSTLLAGARGGTGLGAVAAGLVLVAGVGWGWAVLRGDADVIVEPSDSVPTGPVTDDPTPEGDEETGGADPESGALQSVSAVPVGPGAWSVAASITEPADSNALAAVVATWPGVVSVVPVETPDEWRALTGFDWGCDAGDSGPGCGTGLLAWVVSSQMVQTAMRLESELGMTAVTVDDRPRDFIQGYLDAAIEVASPVPLNFDPTELGAEQPLRNVAESEFTELCDALWACDVAVAVDIDGFVIRAGLSLPSAGDGIPSLGTLESEGGGRDLKLNDFLVDAAGHGGIVADVGDLLGDVGGRRQYTAAGLPLEAAMITTVLADGTAIWQRPIGGMMLIVDQPGTSPREDGGAPLPPFTVLDADGVEIMLIEGTISSPIVIDLRIDPNSLSGTDAGSMVGAVASDVEVVVTDVVEGLGWPSRGMVTTGDAIWSIDSFSDVVLRIDAATRQVTDVPIQHAASLLATTDAVWVVTYNHSTDDATLKRMDPDTLAVTDDVVVDGQVQTAYQVNGDVWVVPFRSSASITQIAPKTSADGSISWQVAATYPAVPGHSSWWSALIDGAIWGTDSHQSLVWRFDPASGQMTGQISTGFDGITEEGAVVSHDAIWVIHHEGTVIRVDRTTREVTGTLQLGGGLRTGAATADALWLPNVERGTITRIDLATREVTDVISVSGAGQPLATDAAIWVPSRASGTVSRIDIESRSVTHTIDVGARARTPFEFDGAIWVSSLEDGTLTRIDVS